MNLIKNHNNLIKISLVFMLIAVFVSGCGKKTPDIVQQFNTDLQTGNYEDILTMIDMPETNNVITKDDLKTYIDNTDLKPFIKADKIKIDKLKTGKRTIVERISTGNKTVEITFALQEDGSYKTTSFTNFCRQILIAVPKGAELTVNDITIDSKTANAVDNHLVSNKTVDVYLIAGPLADLDAKMKSDIETISDTIKYDKDETYDKSITSNSVNYQLTSNLILPSETARDIASDVKSDIENAIRDTKMGKSSEASFEDYFADDNIDKLISNVSSLVTKLNNNQTDFNITRMEYNEEDTSIETNDTVSLKLNIETTFGSQKSRTIHQFTVMNDNGTYKIVDTTFFDSDDIINQYTSKW